MILLLFTVNFAFAQKKPLDHSVYDLWESIGAKQLSNNGLWASYNINVQQGDSTLYFTNTKTRARIIVPRAIKAQFSNDSKFAAYIIRPYYSILRQAKIKKKKAEDMPKDSLGIANLTTSTITKVARVKSFKFPETGFGYIAYLMDKLDTVKSNTTPQKKDADFIADEAAPAGAKKTEGTDLIVKNLITGTDKTYKYVTEYLFSKNGKLLVFTCSGSKKDKTVTKAYFY